MSDLMGSRKNSHTADRIFFALIVGLAVIGFTAKSWAQAHEVRHNYLGARMLGMGGAGIAVVNDETGLLVNPAGLGKLRDVYGTLIDPELEGGANWPELYRASSFSDTFNPEKMLGPLTASPANHFQSKYQLFPSFVVRNFGLGIHISKQLAAQVDSTGNDYSHFYRDDMTLAMGFNFRLWDGILKLGAASRLVSRIEVPANTQPISTGTFAISANAREGLGVGFDAGLTLTSPTAWLPTLSAVVRDLGGTNYDTMSGLRMTTSARPTAGTQDIDVALAVFPIHSNKTRSVFTIEAKKIQEAQSSGNTMRYLHVGYEYNFADLIFIRAGMYQNYWTAGFELASERTQIQFAYYAADIGPVGAPEEDRRWVWKFSYRF